MTSPSSSSPLALDAVALFDRASEVSLQSALGYLDTLPVRLELDMSMPGLDIALQMPHALAATGLTTPPVGYDTARVELITSVSYKHAAGIAAFHQLRAKEDAAIPAYPDVLDGPSRADLHRPPEALVLAALIRTAAFSTQLFSRPAKLLRYVNAHDPRALELLACASGCSIALLEQLDTAGCAISDVLTAARVALGQSLQAPSVEVVPPLGT